MELVIVWITSSDSFAMLHEDAFVEDKGVVCMSLRAGCFD